MSTQKKNTMKAKEDKRVVHDWKTLLHILIISLVFICSFTYTFNSKLDTNGDNALYIELARNLAAGHGFTTEGPGNTQIAHTHFPPGYPLILSLPIFLGADNLIVFKTLNGIMMLIAILLFYLAISKSTGNKMIAFSTGILSAMAPQLLKFATMAMSEMCFMFFMMLALYAMVKMVDEKRKMGPWFWVAALSAIYCYYIRSAGSAVIFSVLAFYLFRNEWKRLLISFATIVAFYVPWFIRNKIIGNERDYLFFILAKNPWRPDEGRISSFSEFMEKVWKNLSDTTVTGYMKILDPKWSGYGSTELSSSVYIIGFIIVAVVLYGLWSNKELRYALLGLLVANTGLLLIWNGNNDIRYVTPFVPLIIYGFWNGLTNLIEVVLFKRATSNARVIPYLAILSSLLVIPQIQEQHDISKSRLPDTHAQYYELAKILNEQSSEENKPVVACRKPELFKYYAPNTIPVRYEWSEDDKYVIRDMIRNGVDYVVFDQLGYSSTKLYLTPAIVNNPQYFRVSQKVGKEKMLSLLLKFDRKRAESELMGD